MARRNFEEILQHLKLIECDGWLLLAGVGWNACELSLLLQGFFSQLSLLSILVLHATQLNGASEFVL